MQATRTAARSVRRAAKCARCLRLNEAVLAPSSIDSRKTAFSTSTSTQIHSSGKQNRLNTISPDEVSHFSSLSQTWWNEKGDFNVLQRMNKVRVEFLRERLRMVARHEQNVTQDSLRSIDGPSPLGGMRVLDVGCGGGLFTERLARLGANTLAIDASEENVKTAAMHASQDPRLLAMMENGQLEYRQSAVEDLAASVASAEATSRVSPMQEEQFDVVFAMEVLEHVADPQGFLRALSDLVKPGGHLILSTISRTPLARLVTITLAESPLLRLAPAGSHTYEKFIRPDELVAFFTEELGWSSLSRAEVLEGSTSGKSSASAHHLAPQHRSLRYDLEVRGTTYLPWQGEWQLFPADDGKGLAQNLAKSCNYFFGARRPL